MARAEWDLLWSVDGDFIFDEDRGDLADTKLVNSRALIQRIVTRMQSMPGDWELAEEIGLSLSSVIGEPNNRATGRRLEELITNELIRDGLLFAREFSVTVFPASKRALGVLVSVFPSGRRGEISIPFVYDMRDNRMVPRRL